MPRFPYTLSYPALPSSALLFIVHKRYLTYFPLHYIPIIGLYSFIFIASPFFYTHSFRAIIIPKRFLTYLTIFWPNHANIEWNRPMITDLFLVIFELVQQSLIPLKITWFCIGHLESYQRMWVLLSFPERSTILAELISPSSIARVYLRTSTVSSRTITFSFRPPKVAGRTRPVPNILDNSLLLGKIRTIPIISSSCAREVVSHAECSQSKLIHLILKRAASVSNKIISLNKAMPLHLSQMHLLTALDYPLIIKRIPWHA